MMDRDLHEGSAGPVPAEPAASGPPFVAEPQPDGYDSGQGGYDSGQGGYDDFGLAGFAAEPPDPLPPAPAGFIPEDHPGVTVRAWRAFTRWRRRRPFWGALLIILAGTEIALTQLAPVKVVVHLGVEGLAGQAVPIVMILCGLLLWFSPEQRMFYAILSVLLSLASWVTSNLGGFFVGLLLGVIGGSAAFAWSPRRPRKAPDLPPPPTADSAVE
jgi:hypothetical protein